MRKLSTWDRLTLSIAPRWTLQRLRARMAIDSFVRHYEAASGGRRTSGWARNSGDANSVLSGAIHELRMHARDLTRNNGWARKAQRIISTSTVGTGIVPKAVHDDKRIAQDAMQLWKRWANTTECESEGRHTFASLQNLAMRALATDGEVLIRRRYRQAKDNLTIPLQLQILEADYLDTSRTLPTSDSGGPIVQGVEFDLLGRRSAYWLFTQHPGALTGKPAISKRVPASEIIHVFYAERPGMARGVSWFGAGIVPLKDFDEYEDATLLRQKIAACFAAFVSDIDGAGGALGEQSQTRDDIETIEPGTVSYLSPGRQVTFGNPPATVESSYDVRTLRKIAAALGVSYEDLTGDYSQVNFSSARMSRLAFWANVLDWRWQMVIPIMCNGVWAWAMEAAQIAGEIPAGDLPTADWTAPPMTMIEPDKEGLAYQRLVRTGAMTPSEMVREQGGDPEAHWEEYAADLKKLDALGIQLDSDVRKVSQAGLTQQRVGFSGGASADAEPTAAPDQPKRAPDDFEIVVEVDDTRVLGGSR
jgi:lambda family phage portal protein